MGLQFSDYMKRFAGKPVFYGNATHAFRDVMVWLNLHLPKKEPNIIMPEYIPAKLYRIVLAAGYTPRFYEIYGNCEFDLDEIKSLIDEKSQAIFVVHYFGLPSRVMDVKGLAAQAGVYVIEDCAHTVCSQSDGRELGTIGDCSIFSMRKMLLTPEGGFLVLNKCEWDFEPSYSKRVSSLYTVCGLLRTRAKRGYLFLTGGRDPIHLARLPNTGYIDLSEKQHVNVKRVSFLTEEYTKHVDLEKIVAMRRRNYRHLSENVADLSYVQPLCRELPEGCTPYSFPVRISGGGRDKLRTQLLEMGISCGAGWPESPFEARFTRTAELSTELLELPIHQGISHAQLTRMLECLHGFTKDT
jgi:perosamine synthetase